MAYTKTSWVNDSAPHINAENLNKIEQGIEDAHNSSFTETKVLATQLTGLTLISSEISANDSVLVAFGKLQKQIKSGGGGVSNIESFDVPINSGWQANLDDVPSALQTFRKKSGVVVSNGVYLVKTPITAGNVIATLPVALRPSYRVRGVAFAQIAGQNSFSPVHFYIETNGEFAIVITPPTEFSLILEVTYFV